MPEQPSGDFDRSATIESLTRTQHMLLETLASGAVPVKDEIEARLKLVDIFLNTYIHLQHPEFIDFAIQHLETILRRAPKECVEYPEYLGRLSKARMSEYLSSGSTHALDVAVQNGHRALDSATAVDLREHNLEAYTEILIHLSYARSRRHVLSGDPVDLDIAITCMMEVSEIAIEGSDPHRISLNNLASQLRRRFVQTQDQDNLDEAERLMHQLLSFPVLDPRQTAMTEGQLGFIAYDKFKASHSPIDSDKAIEHSRSCLEVLPHGHELRLDVLTMLVDLYEARHGMESSLRDLASLVHYSGLLFNELPVNHRLWAKCLLKHLQHTDEYVSKEPSLQMLEETIPNLWEKMRITDFEYDERERCQLHFSNLLGTRYSMSLELQHLIVLVEFTRDMVDERNKKAKRPGSKKQAVVFGWGFLDFKTKLGLLARAAPEHPMRCLAEQELAGCFLSLHTAGKAAVLVLENLYIEQRLRLQVILQAIDEGQELSEADLYSAVKNQETGQNPGQKPTRKSARTAEFDRRLRAYLEAVEESGDVQATMQELQAQGGYETGQSSRQEVSRISEYTTEFGLRRLAIEPESKSIVWDMRTLVEANLGYDPTKKLSAKDFIAREAQEEQKAIDIARSQGKHPNLSLCRMCRDFARPLRPVGNGFELTAQNCILPFGNFYQLICREHCAICRLILSAITAVSGDLNPVLKAIDPEVQGIRLSTGTLKSGERVMRIDYGLKHVCDLRVVTPQNRRQAVRQAWEENAEEKAHASLGLDDNIRAESTLERSQQQVNLKQIKQWLNTCDHVHGSSCNGPKSEYLAALDMSMIFIDVIDQCLVARTSREKYFALSYVWGQVDMCMTLQSNYEERKIHDSLSQLPFPKAITDAINLVHSLGERYLWIDALCIVQDDNEHLERHIPRMNIIYGKAFATIVALHGDDANAGLPGVTPESRSPQQIETIQVSSRSKELQHDSRSDDVEELRLVATPPSLHLVLEASKWNTRGWILQERLLSRRCLYFSPGAVYFQCGTETFSEGGTNEAYSACLFDRSPIKDEHVSKLANHNNPLNDIDRMYFKDIPERFVWIFRVYKRLIENYSTREFTFKPDVLRGFAGIFAALNRHFNGQTLCGLPVAIFTHALLWSPATRLPRRGARLPTPSDMSMGKPDPQFPSWSWAGWDGPVEYRLFHEMGVDMELPTPMVRIYQIGPDSSPYFVETGEYSCVLVNNAAEGQNSTSFHEQTIDKSSSSKQAERGSKLDSGGKPQDEGSDRTQLLQDDSQEASSSGDSKRNYDKKGKQKAQGFNDIQTAVSVVPDPSHGTSWVVAPPQPHEPWDPPAESTILSFEALTVPCDAFRLSSEKEYLSKQSQVHTASRQAVRRVYDQKGNQCGLWWEQAGYGYVGLDMKDAREAERRIHLVGISYYGSVYHAREGPSRVEGEIPFFDHKHFPSTGPGSGLVNSLVVDADLDEPDKIGYRCTVAVIHMLAWLAAGPCQRKLRVA